eukprot:7005025-Pyramimonas_sp.AAC.1
MVQRPLFPGGMARERTLSSRFPKQCLHLVALASFLENCAYPSVWAAMWSPSPPHRSGPARRSGGYVVAPSPVAAWAFVTWQGFELLCVASS